MELTTKNQAKLIDQNKSLYRKVIVAVATVIIILSSSPFILLQKNAKVKEASGLPLKEFFRLYHLQTMIEAVLWHGRVWTFPYFDF